MRTLPTCAAISFLAIAASASANVYVFDNAVSYTSFCNDLSIVGQNQGFNAFSGSFASISGGVGDYAWTATANSGVFVDPNSVLRTRVTSQTLSFSFASSNVYSVGGYFFNTDVAGTFHNGTMKIHLSDGTNFIRTVSNSTTFSGFISDGVSITSLEISHAGNSGSSYFVSSSGINVGVVPAPGALAFIGLAGIVARRRRA